MNLICFIYLNNNKRNNIGHNINERNNITIAQISSALGISTRSVQRIIKDLVNKGDIVRVGTKNGYWKVNK